MHKIVVDDGIKINHLIDHQHTMESAVRNIRYLLTEYNQDKEKTDPRTIAYLGRMLFSVGEFDKALPFLEKHINKSGWDEDRHTSWCQISEIMLQKEDYDTAIAAAFEAIQECPSFPDGYLKLHNIYT